LVQAAQAIVQVTVVKTDKKLFLVRLHQLVVVEADLPEEILAQVNLVGLAVVVVARMD
jgi:hypothetical protein